MTGGKAQAAGRWPAAEGARRTGCAGHATQAGVLLRQALEISQRIGAAEAPDLLAELDALTRPATRTVSHGIAPARWRPDGLRKTQIRRLSSGSES